MARHREIPAIIAILERGRKRRVSMKNKEAAIAAIRTCKTSGSLDDMLKRFELVDAQETIDCLNECMYSPERFFSNRQISIEDELEFTKQIFLTGTWRLNEYYERMGIPSLEAASDHA
jgi:hypothetical protein